MSASKWFYFALAGLVGIAASIAFVYITQYYTAGNWRPVRTIAEASRTGSATNIISGLAIGFETTAVPAVTISLAIGGAFFLGTRTHVTGNNLQDGIFGTACATVGMLMSAGYILAMDTFGPITDNAGGIVEMSNQPESVRDVTDALDSVGNTTKALTKGYAVGSAALAAFLLFSAYLDVVAESRGFAPNSAAMGRVAHRRPRAAEGLHRRLPRPDARLPLLLARDPRGRQRGAGHDQRGAPPVAREAGHHGGHRSRPTTRAAWTFRCAARCAR